MTVQDYPGRLRIVVNENDADSQLGLIWGIRSANYSAASTAACVYEAEALTPYSPAAIATVTGASGGGSNNVIQHANLATSWTPVLSTQILSGSLHMTHVGSYRVWARAYTTSTTPPRLRFLWDVGDLVFPVENTATQIPGASNFYAVDLGAIRLDPTSGTHRWQGMIQAKGAVGGENVSIDRLWIVPTDDGYGVLRAPVTLNQGLAAYSARDEFNQSAGNLTGKTAAIGGVWAGAGDATDLAVEATGHTVQRSEISDASVQAGRFAISGVSAFAAQVVTVDVKLGATVQDTIWGGPVARYTDTSNFVAALLLPFGGSTGLAKLFVYQYTTAGGLAVLASSSGGAASSPAASIRYSATAWYTLSMMVTTDGRVFVWLTDQGVTPTGNPSLVGSSTALAAAGALASGKPGFLDVYTTTPAVTRSYDNFAAWVPTPDAVMYASQSAELRTDGMFREESTGTAWGPVSHVTGNLPRLPPSGLEARSVELFVKGSRGDLENLPDAGIDDISVQVYSRPSWLHVPEA